MIQQNQNKDIILRQEAMELTLIHGCINWFQKKPSQLKAVYNTKTTIFFLEVKWLCECDAGKRLIMYIDLHFTSAVIIVMIVTHAIY